MNCYVHRERAAIGLCIWCGRGLCEECAVEMDSVLACRHRCEMDVQQVQRVRRLSVHQATVGKRNLQTRKTLNVMCGVALLAGGATATMASFTHGSHVPNAVGIWVAILGGILVVFALGTKIPAERPCPKCGHELHGTPGERCPKCGHAVLRS